MVDYPPEYIIIIIIRDAWVMKGRLYSGGGCKRWRSPRHSGLSGLKRVWCGLARNTSWRSLVRGRGLIFRHGGAPCVIIIHCGQYCISTEYIDKGL